MKPIASKISALVALGAAVLAAHPAFAATVTVGGNDQGSNAPFGGNNSTAAFPGGINYSGEYQEIVNSAAFAPGTVSITKVAFQSAKINGPDDINGNIAETVNYNGLVVKLGTTTANAAGANVTLNTTPDTRPGNTGAGHPVMVAGQNGASSATTVFSGNLSANLVANDVYDVVITFTTPFTYNPSIGNLLMDINIGTDSAVGASGQTDSFNYGTFANTGTVAYSSGNDNPQFIAGNGLLAQFTTAPVVVTPEPSSLVVMLVGGLGLLAAARRRNALGQN